MQLFRDLLLNDVLARRHADFHATTEAHGLYNTQQFVLRLSPLIHNKLASLTPGLKMNSEVGLEGAQAMSTYLHETIHWWQHIGSTYGFFLSLNYPVQAHCTHHDLKKLVDQDGFKKSVYLQAVELNERGPSGLGTTAGLANIIINNHFDLLTFRSFTLGPKIAASVIERNLFEAVGHALYITYAHTLNALASSVDRNFDVISHPKEWSDKFNALKEGKVEGYYYGSPIKMFPIGALEIFEGQARFSQIQYLSHACGHRLDWDDFRSLGMLSGVYVEAFKLFLQFSDSDWPERINDPLVGLFLLICDLAINPGSGFPLPAIPNFETFIDDVNPGARFCMLCRLIALQHPEMKQAVKTHSRMEYEALSTKLCESLKEAPPLDIAKIFSDWFSEAGPLANLRDEYKTYIFKPGNYAIRHLFAHFLAFQEDKYKRPEFFCWPGAWLAGELASIENSAIFEKHAALFVDREFENGVFPRIQIGRDEATVQVTFDEFYRNNVIYELVNQWIESPGAFSYNFSWLVPERAGDIKRYLQRQFSGAFDLDLDKVTLLS